jgi:hypothetical protein
VLIILTFKDYITDLTFPSGIIEEADEDNRQIPDVILITNKQTKKTLKKLLRKLLLQISSWSKYS